jgi:hypothetical protein
MAKKYFVYIKIYLEKAVDTGRKVFDIFGKTRLFKAA